ncbi:FAD-dependent monooxygenase [Komagataeibacter rhaeticus]|uniref:FAD-dependent monooxygenase n=1 Tax=Komagataeibacter rhaeticus TaxID=215221 RepID=UPI0039EA5241
MGGETGEHMIRARFLVGTDGGRSFVRHALAIDFPGEALGVRAIVADVRLEGLDRSVWHRFQLGSSPLVRSMNSSTKMAISPKLTGSNPVSGCSYVRTVTSPGSFPLTDWSRNFRATSRMCCRPARPIHSQGHDGGEADGRLSDRNNRKAPDQYCENL